MSLLSREDLISALRVTTHEVKLFAWQSVEFIRIAPAIALLLMETGEYEGGGSPRRCRYLRPTCAPRPIPGPDPRDSKDFRPSDSGLSGFLRYPMKDGGSGIQFPALFRMGAGL